MNEKVRDAPFPTYQERHYMLSIKYTGKAFALPIQNFFKVTKVTLVKTKILDTNPKSHYKSRN